MEGKERGVQARVKNIYRRAHYTHCHCHQMQLVVKKACEQNEESIEFFENVRKISSFFNKSVESKRIEKNVQEEVCQQDQVLGGVILVEQ